MEPATAALIARAAIAAGTNKKVWTGIASVLAALCLPVILAVMCYISIASGGTEHNRAAVHLAFDGGEAPDGMPADYQAYVRQMQESFAELDAILDDIDGMTEGELCDRYLVKSVFYSLYFGADPTDQNVASLLNVNTQDSALEAFFKKFMEQAQNPVHTGIFVMTENALNKLIRIDFDPEILENYRIDPSERLQTQEQRQFEPLDVTKIDLADMEKKGIRMEDIEPHLKAMSYGHKSNGLVEMNPELENGMRVSTKGRVSLEEQADGSLRVVPHYWQERPDLDAPFHGVLLDEEAKTNLMNTRHAGKVIDLELEPGKLTPCYVSIDKWTNTLEPMPVSLLEKRARIKEADLSEGKQMDFYGGGKVLLEGYTTRAGYKRDAYIQIDAAERNYSFTYDGLDRNRYAQENKEIYRQKAAEKNGRQETTASERQPTLTIHRTILKASVPKEAYDQWTEAVNDPSKRADVKAFYIKGMVKDGQGEPFNAWVKPNFERNKMDFFRWNPDRAKRQGAEVKPAVESRTQVAVNSEGKTVEAVKGVKEPLKQGQQEATPAQRRNYRSCKKSNSKGVKV